MFEANKLIINKSIIIMEFMSQLPVVLYASAHMLLANQKLIKKNFTKRTIFPIYLIL